MSDFRSFRDVKRARKASVCEECGHPINIGDHYRYRFGRYEGDTYAQAAHIECENWANSVMCYDDGRGFLKDSDPEEEYELDEDVRRNPPSDLIRSRLPKVWLTAVDRILADPHPSPLGPETGGE